MQYSNLFILLLGSLIYTACNSVNDQTATNSPETEPLQEEEILNTPQDTVFAWVNQLNIRAKPDTKSKVLTKVNEGDPLILTGEKTNFISAIQLRGTEYTEPWIEVKTTDGTTGWVFKGATKRPGDGKGLPYLLGKLDTFMISACSAEVTSEGCACSFSIGDPFKGPTIFYSNMGDYACVKINETMPLLYDRHVDFKKQLSNLAQSEYWITLNFKGPTLYFGQPLEYYGYEDGIEFLTDVLLASAQSFEVIPIQNNAQGMGMRETQDLANEAIAKAAELKATGFEDSLNYLVYDNDDFKVIVRTRRMTNYEGEANTYEGNMMLIAKDGKTILDRKQVSGTCAC